MARGISISQAPNKVGNDFEPIERNEPALRFEGTMEKIEVQLLFSTTRPKNVLLRSTVKNQLCEKLS